MSEIKMKMSKALKKQIISLISSIVGLGIFWNETSLLCTIGLFIFTLGNNIQLNINRE